MPITAETGYEFQIQQSNYSIWLIDFPPRNYLLSWRQKIVVKICKTSFYMVELIPGHNSRVLTVCPISFSVHTANMGHNTSLYFVCLLICDIKAEFALLWPIRTIFLYIHLWMFNFPRNLHLYIDIACDFIKL